MNRPAITHPAPSVHETFVCHSRTALNRIHGFTLFLGDAIRLGLTWVAPLLVFRLAESTAAAASPDCAPEIIGAAIILCLGGIAFLLIGPLRLPLRRLIRWVLCEEPGFKSYGTGVHTSLQR